MTDQHLITLPYELVHQWASEFYGTITAPGEASIAIANQAARWGSDQELEACCEWVEKTIPSWAPHALNEQLRAARRPQPPSLKERALQAWAAVDAGTDDQAAMSVIRRALEQLDD